MQRQVASRMRMKLGRGRANRVARYDDLSYCDDRGTHSCPHVTHGARGAQMIGGFGALIRAQEKSLSLPGPIPFSS